MSRFRRALLRLLDWFEARTSALHTRLREEHEAARIEERRAELGGFRDGETVRVVSVTCRRCREHVGTVRRIRRLSLEATSDGEWVLLDDQGVDFLCAAGTVLESASVPAKGAA